MIWEDNMQFLQDKNIFEQTYFWYVEQCIFTMYSKILNKGFLDTTYIGIY